jgi:8-oxo-dGTP pyrophosphatase MutT (NUDIX family)
MREAGIQRIEVHVAGACVRETIAGLTMLAMHRAPTRTLFPDFWEGVGGQVDPGRSLEEAVLQHQHEEAGLAGVVLAPVDTYVIDPGPDSGADERIPGIRFLVRVLGAAEPTIDPRQHQGWRWIPVRELPRVNWIPGMLEQLRKAATLYQALS